MRIEIITLFPEWVQSVGQIGVTGRALENGLINLQAHNPRDFTDDVHRTVDDRPYGGGPGMVMKVKPLRAAIRAARAAAPGASVVYLSPQGDRLDQSLAREMARQEAIILLAGRYEGIDQRVIERDVDSELSLGDYVLSGGELAAMVVVDVLARLQPGALGDDESAKQDSFSDGLLDFPHYTRPVEVDGQVVPTELLSGDHAAIQRWRRQQALGATAQRRPDLMTRIAMDATDKALLDEYLNEIKPVCEGPVNSKAE